jgi:hypothetical protein
MSPKNPGNTGHRGYHMSRVTAIVPQGNVVIVSLECGYNDRWYPYHGYTAEQWAQHIQLNDSLKIGKTRLRCTERHKSEVQI